ncbi:MAG: hypothetical protein JW944_05930 [Deltaproteobacteria bacterium]|nr:hypothetical protein [Deltaproteobacteria bacterium]
MEKKDIKDGLKKMAKEAEVKLTGALLKWKDQADGREYPDPDAIDKRSRIIADRANEIFKRRGKTIIREFMDVYIKKAGKEDKEK